jgi:orotidine-5'-phosphate decarboxylase
MTAKAVEGRSVVIAADMDPERFLGVVTETSDLDGISAYKIGFGLALSKLGLPEAVEIVKSRSDKGVIYDHQKGGTDIPDTGKIFAARMAEAEVDASILFPFTGPDVEEAWIRELQEAKIEPIVGAEMTHTNISGDRGYIKNDAFKRMFEQAIGLGVKNFVVPGNKPDRVATYREFFESMLDGDYAMFAPGFVAQGGEISEAGKVAGKNWHAIVGRGIFKAADVRTAAMEHTQQIVSGSEHGS